MSLITIIEAGGYPLLILGCAAWIEGKLNTDTLKRVADSIKSSDFVVNVSAFQEIFKSVFSNKHLTFLCFRRSTLASLVCLLSIGLISLASNTRFFFNPVDSLATQLSGTIERHGQYIETILIVLVITNIFADYISLLTTRKILDVIESLSMRIFAAFVVLDSCLNIIIWLAFYTFFLVLVFIIDFIKIAGVQWSSYVIVLPTFLDVMVRAQLEGTVVYLLTNKLPVAETADGFFRPIFSGSIAWASLVSTFITSIWLWIYIVFVMVFKLLNKFLGMTAIFWKVDEHPVQLLATPVAIIALLLYWML